VGLAGGVLVQQLGEGAVERRIEEAVDAVTGRSGSARPHAGRVARTGTQADETPPVPIRTGAALDLVANGSDDTRLSGGGLGGALLKNSRTAGRSGGPARAPTQTGTTCRRASAAETRVASHAGNTAGTAEASVAGRAGTTAGAAETSVAPGRAARSAPAEGIRDAGPCPRRASRARRPAVRDRERPRSTGAAQRHDQPCCDAEIEPHA